MKKFLITFTGLLVALFSFSQTDSDKLLELGKAYKNFMFRNDPTKDDIKQLRSNVPGNFKAANEFIIQTLTRNNKLLGKDYLSRPTDETLKQVYIIRAINYNLRDENPVPHQQLIDSLGNKQISAYELVDCYYDLLFTAVGNKNQPFNLAKTDIKLNDYNLKDDTEKGIVFLEAMRLCGVVIWGYMNVVKPPNTQKAYEFIKKYPKFNGRPYYQYNDLYFTDFEMVIDSDKGMQSYKSYYLDKYYETLLSHLIVLNREGASEKEVNDLLLGSILKETNLYKYSSSKETLEQIFKKQNTDK